MKKIGFLKRVIGLFMVPGFLFFLSTASLAEEEYTFKRMWPVLPQPWYFCDHRGLAMDSKGNLYVTGELRIQKLSSGGEFITEWGARVRETV